MSCAHLNQLPAQVPPSRPTPHNNNNVCPPKAPRPSKWVPSNDAFLAALPGHFPSCETRFYFIRFEDFWLLCEPSYHVLLLAISSPPTQFVHKRHRISN